jgi:DNA-binding YbaB/EbfC family protein
METQEKINETIYEGKSSIVTVKMNGKKELVDVKIAIDEIEKDDVELLQDMVMVAINDAIKQINDVTEKEMGAYTKGMPGLF